MKTPPIEIKEREIVYLFWFLYVVRLPRTPNRAKEVLRNSASAWHITAADIDALWPGVAR